MSSKIDNPCLVLATLVIAASILASCQSPPEAPSVGKAYMNFQGQQISLADYPSPFIKNGVADFEIIIQDAPTGQDTANAMALKLSIPGAPDPVTPAQALKTKNAVIIGNPCTNSLIRTLWDIPARACDIGLNPNEAQLILEQAETQVGLFIVSPSSDAIAKAVAVLADRQKYPLRGLNISVSGPSDNLSVEQECQGGVIQRSCLSPNTLNAKYCSRGDLIDACQFCGCAQGWICSGEFKACVQENQTQVITVTNQSQQNLWSELPQAQTESVQFQSGISAFALKHKQYVDLQANGGSLGAIAFFSYDPSKSPPWSVFRPGVPSDLTRLEPGKAYYVQADYQANVNLPLSSQVEGFVINSQTGSGAYLIGATGNASRPLSSVINQSLGITVRELYSISQSRSDSMPTSPSTLLEPGVAYWAIINNPGRS